MLSKEKFKLPCKEFFLANRVFSAWNRPPSDIENSPSVNTFKNALDRWFESERVRDWCTGLSFFCYIMNILKIILFF